MYFLHSDLPQEAAVDATISDTKINCKALFRMTGLSKKKVVRQEECNEPESDAI
jgi:hypothetical protein